ncbi:alpha/beta hydrolase family protein [Allorhodopirellula heiligendammensis]|uniref:Alpha/beta hydrolase family protein n=1 Tax=Allorhodopirellula heiligendammensis TaxID=2714739 RepID=A0A5C6C2P7_9BACT|nr:alpha/beta hydrolase [Allorhodopirellula heiligendammensis]TWU18398.1 Alpha/beta hydrolase family protein [Allorhodopirellula heiligendammensis]
MTGFKRRSYRVDFLGGANFQLAGIVDQPTLAGESGEPSAAVSGPVAVFSHCFTCNKDLKAITRISRRLAECGIAVLRFDMTGLGGSEGDFSNTNFSTNMADLAAAVRFATETLGPVTALIGHSFGGAASLATAAGMPFNDDAELSTELRKRLAAVISIAAPSDTQHLADLLLRMNPEIQSNGRGDVTIGGLTWSIRREMLDDFRSHRLADYLNRIRSRVLAFHSPVDQTLGYDHALRIASLIEDEQGLPRCSLLTLSDADHLLVNNPADAQYVADMSAAFLRRYASA